MYHWNLQWNSLLYFSRFLVWAHTVYPRQELLFCYYLASGKNCGCLIFDIVTVYTWMTEFSQEMFNTMASKPLPELGLVSLVDVQISIILILSLWTCIMFRKGYFADSWWYHISEKQAYLWQGRRFKMYLIKKIDVIK